jgi:hypothetical protein
LELSLSNAPLAFNATCNIEDISGATFATNWATNVKRTHFSKTQLKLLERPVITPTLYTCCCCLATTPTFVFLVSKLRRIFNDIKLTKEDGEASFRPLYHFGDKSTVFPCDWIRQTSQRSCSPWNRISICRRCRSLTVAHSVWRHW